MMDFRILPLKVGVGITKELVEQINALLQQLSTRLKPRSQTDVNAILEHSEIFVARPMIVHGDRHRRIVGMATLVPVHKPSSFEGTIEDVIVDEDHRRKGIGRALATHLITRSRERGMGAVYLTNERGRTHSLNLYAKLGFKLYDADLLVLPFPR